MGRLKHNSQSLLMSNLMCQVKLSTTDFNVGSLLSRLKNLSLIAIAFYFLGVKLPLSGLVKNKN